MKATGLRRVCGLAACAALVACAWFLAPQATADEGALKSAFDDYAAGRYEDALQKLTEYAASNPGDDEVYRVLRDVDERVKLRALAQGGEHERLMRYLLDKAKPQVEAKRRDADMIKALVEQSLSNEIDVRRRANLELATKSGDYAVPYLLPYLGDADVGKVVNAIFALHAIGGEAVLPLCEALRAPDARLRGYAAVVLGDIRDPRALPALRAAAESDADEVVKQKAAAAVAKVRPDGAAVGTADSFVRFGQRYYAGDPAVIVEPDQVHNLWRWEGEGLARYEVPAGLFGYQLAQMHALYALKADPAHMGAKSLLVRAVLAQILTGDAMGDRAPEALKAAWTLARSQGFAAASAALHDAVMMKDWDVAVLGCRLVSDTYGRQPLAGHPLGAALGASEKRVQYAAAIAALRMSPASAFEKADQVPFLAAQAASAAALRQVFVIDDRAQPRGKLGQDLRDAGYVVSDDGDGFRAVGRLKGAPSVDVVVVRADLGAEGTIPSRRWIGTRSVIDELQADYRTKNMRVVVVGSAEAKEVLAQQYGDKIAGFLVEPMDGQTVQDTIAAAVEKGDMNAERALVLAVAAEAADAFAAANPCCTAWDFKVAVASLAEAAEKGETDDIKRNAVRALGNLRVGGAKALAAVLGNAEASEELRALAAKSLGMVLSNVAPEGDEVDALVAAAKGEGSVRDAAMEGLGMVKALAPDVARQVFEDHRLDVGTKGE